MGKDTLETIKNWNMDSIVDKSLILMLIFLNLIAVRWLYNM